MEHEQRIKVALRMRPPLPRERYDTQCARKLDDGQTISLSNEDAAQSAFSYDFSFDESDDQQSFYEEAALEMVDCSLTGSNVTIFTYGQTGSGKTYTILGQIGKDGHVSAQTGLFLRVFEDLFLYRRRVQAQREVAMTLSAIELYVDEVMDLLNNKTKIKLRETADETTMVGLTKIEVKEMRDVVKCFEIANSFRSTAPTKMNDASSRSHALFLIDLFQLERSDSSSSTMTLQQMINESESGRSPSTASSPSFSFKKSRIALVDLAGSERVKKSGVEGQAMVEAQAINKSLSTLGTVINAMYMQSAHVPFRESKLTKILKTSFLDPRSRLLLVGQISPMTESQSETMGTLRFCDRVKGLKIGTVSAYGNPEEEAAYLQALKQNELLSADVRIAAAAHLYRVQRPRMAALAHRRSTQDEINDSIDRLRQTAGKLEEERLERELKPARDAAVTERDATVERFRTQFAALQSAVAEAEQQIRNESAAKESHKKELEDATESQMTLAKKAKKKRLSSEEKVTKIKDQVDVATKELEELNKRLMMFGDLTSIIERAAKTTKKGTGPSTTAADDFDADDDEITTTSKKVTVDAAKPTKKAAASNFDDDDDEKEPSPQTQALVPPAVSRDLAPPLPSASSGTSSSSSLVANETEWNAFEQDWKVNEANHLVVSDFFDQVQHLNPLHLKYIKLMQQNWRLWGAANAAKMRNSEILTRSTLIPDILTFLVDRAVLISEGVLSTNDTYAWFDIDGLSTKLKDPIAWHPPLVLDSSRFPVPVGPVVHSQVTNLSDDSDDDAMAPSPTEVTVGALIGVREGSGATGSSVRSNASTPNDATTDPMNRRTSMREPQPNLTGARGTVVSPPPAPATAAATTINNNTSSVTKKYETEEADKQYLMQVYDSPTLVNDVTKYLKAGTALMKHGRSGRPHSRIFWVASVSFRIELVWVDPDDKTADRSCISLNDVSYIALGCFSKVFKRHPIPNTQSEFFLCFTVGLKDGGRTVDIVAGTLPDFEAWVLGLAHLSRVDPHWGKPLDLSQYQEASMLSEAEKLVCEQNYIFPSVYLKIKERIVRVKEDVMMHLRLFGNDPEQAFASMGGIHLPQLNDKGAILMTKGELRHHCNVYKVDIFRVCKLWVLFHSMNLIYDPSFTPATNFGVTFRK